MSVAVSMPDARKGERIVLLTTQKDADRDAMQRQAKATGASELSVPADIRVVDKVPLLGSGKTDYVGATALARSRQRRAPRSRKLRDRKKPRARSAGARSPGVVLLHGIARHVAIAAQAGEGAAAAGFATLNLDYQSRSKPLDALADGDSSRHRRVRGRHRRPDPFRRPFDGRIAGAGLCGARTGRPSWAASSCWARPTAAARSPTF